MNSDHVAMRLPENLPPGIAYEFKLDRVSEGETAAVGTLPLAHGAP